MTKNTKNHRILYVEDYPVIQTMYVDVLKSHGFSIDVASDGKQALEKVAEHAYDIVLLDLLLPNVTGMEFLREYIKNNSPLNVVILTDFDKPETVDEVKGLGVKHFWIKVENTPHLLAERLEHLLEEKKNHS